MAGIIVDSEMYDRMMKKTGSWDNEADLDGVAKHELGRALFDFAIKDSAGLKTTRAVTSCLEGVQHVSQATLKEARERAQIGRAVV